MIEHDEVGSNEVGRGTAGRNSLRPYISRGGTSLRMNGDGKRTGRVIVIGGGFGGLAAAIRLQAAGHRVTLVEARERLGGRAYQLQDGGFTFDMGPTLITAP